MSPAMAAGMKPLAFVRLATITYLVGSLLDRDGIAQEDIIAHLVANNEAVSRFAGGTSMLRVAGVTATCTAGPRCGLIHAWHRAATRRIEKEKATHGADIVQRTAAALFKDIVEEMRGLA